MRNAIAIMLALGTLGAGTALARASPEAPDRQPVAPEATPETAPTEPAPLEAAHEPPANAFSEFWRRPSLNETNRPAQRAEPAPAVPPAGHRSTQVRAAPSSGNPASASRGQNSLARQSSTGASAQSLRPVVAPPVKASPFQFETGGSQTTSVQARGVNARPVTTTGIKVNPVKVQGIRARPVKVQDVKVRPVQARGVTVQPVRARAIQVSR